MAEVSSPSFGKMHFKASPANNDVLGKPDTLDVEETKSSQIENILKFGSEKAFVVTLLEMLEHYCFSMSGSIFHRGLYPFSFVVTSLLMKHLV